MVACALLVGKPTPETFVLLGATVLTGLLGLVDDASKVVKERSLGLTPKMKLVGQFAIATAFVLVAVNCLGIQPVVVDIFLATLDFGLLTTVVPIGDGIAIPWLYLLFMNILLVGMCNAVNLTRRPGRPGGGNCRDRHDRHGRHHTARTCWSPPSSRRRWREPVPGLHQPSRPRFLSDTGSLALGMALGCLAVVT